MLYTFLLNQSDQDDLDSFVRWSTYFFRISLISVGAANADQAGGAAGATATGTDGIIIWFSVPLFPVTRVTVFFQMFLTPNFVQMYIQCNNIGS